MDETTSIIDSIKRRVKFRKVIILLCLIVLIFGILSFLFYGFDTTNNAIKLISKKEQLKKVEKVMLGPKIRFEYDDGQLFDIKARKAVHKDENNVELFNINASGNFGNITAGNLLITNNGNDLHFSNNPILIIRELNNEQ